MCREKQSAIRYWCCSSKDERLSQVVVEHGGLGEGRSQLLEENQFALLLGPTTMLAVVAGQNRLEITVPVGWALNTNNQLTAGQTEGRLTVSRCTLMCCCYAATGVQYSKMRGCVVADGQRRLPIFWWLQVFGEARIIVDCPAPAVRQRIWRSHRFEGNRCCLCCCCWCNSKDGVVGQWGMFGGHGEWMKTHVAVAAALVGALKVRGCAMVTGQ